MSSPSIFSIASAAAPPLVSKFSHRSGCIVSTLQTGSPVWCSCTLLGDTHCRKVSQYALLSFLHPAFMYGNDRMTIAMDLVVPPAYIRNSSA